MAVDLGDISSVLAKNDTNQMLASILLELRTMNIILINALGIKDEVTDIRGSLVLSDFFNTTP